MSTQVKAFVPVVITDDKLISSSIAEPYINEPLWSPVPTYTEFSRVSVITANSHLVYEALNLAGNLNKPPATSPTFWILRGKTMRYRMFDWNQGEVSVGQSPLTVVIRPKQRISAVVLERIKAADIEMSVTDGIGGKVVYTLDGYLRSRNGNTYGDYFFEQFVYDSVVSTFDIPPIPDPVISITLSDPSGVCEIGRFAVGLHTDIGYVVWESGFEYENYSEIDRDAFGKATLNPIPGIPTLEMTLELDARAVNKAIQFEKMTNAVPTVWSAMEGIESYRQMHVLIGIHKRFKITPQNHKMARIDLKLEGI